MTAERLAKIESDLRGAVVHRRYAEVERLAELYCAAAGALAKSLTHGDPEIARILLHAEETLDWARLMIATARAATTDEMRRLPFLSRYVGSAERPRAGGVAVDA